MTDSRGPLATQLGLVIMPAESTKPGGVLGGKCQGVGELAPFYVHERQWMHLLNPW